MLIAAFNDFKQSNNHNILRPRILGLVLFCSMVENPIAPENLLSRFGVDAIIKGEQKTAIGSSGYSINGQAKKILDRGCIGFIQKPFTLNELSLKLWEALV